ncbi:RNA-directed DNA polymerase, eukaryota [Tanacetum coccineum]
MWPVILTTYNLPPWLFMNESSFVLTLLIPGPKSPGKDIDVYLRPLIDDLKDLWAKPAESIVEPTTAEKVDCVEIIKHFVNLDDDIIDEEDPIPHDLADSDDEDLVNLDIDDGMSADVARGHGGDGGGDDRPPSHQIPTSCGGCLGNQGKGTQKPNLGGRRAGR